MLLQKSQLHRLLPAKKLRTCQTLILSQQVTVSINTATELTVHSTRSDELNVRIHSIITLSDFYVKLRKFSPSIQQTFF